MRVTTSNQVRIQIDNKQELVLNRSQTIELFRELSKILDREEVYPNYDFSKFPKDLDLSFNLERVLPVESNW